jgi:hypothetical protein
MCAADFAACVCLLLRSQSGGGEIVDFLMYMFVLGPAVEWCLKSPRVNRGRQASPQGIALAALLLACIAGAKLSYELYDRQPSHFETLGVRTDSTTYAIKRAYKDISLKYHPDKNPDDKKAAEKFIRYQAAYEVLKDTSKRDAYNKFGPAGLDASMSDSASQLWSLSLFYVIWIVVGYLLTMGKASEDGRTWAFSGLLTLAVFEYQTKILSVDYLAPLFPLSTIHEKIEILHKLFPPFLHGARMISQVIFMDVSMVNKLRLEEAHLKTDDLFKMMAALTNGTSLTRPPPASVNGGGLGSGAAAEKSAAVNALATETGAKLHSRGQLPIVGTAEAPAAADGTAAAGGAAGAAGGAAAAVGKDAAAQYAAQAAAAEAAAADARNKERWQNIVIFFLVYTAFKYVTEKDLL